VAPERESHRVCDPITLDAVWYRQFSGASRLARGREEFSLRISHCLDPDGWTAADRCPTLTDRKQGRVLRDHGVEKKEQEKFSQEYLCLLTCLLIGNSCALTLTALT
jgi:hypothetical protein